MASPILWCLLVAAPLASQELRWQLPARGGAIYDRKLKVDSVVEPRDAWIPGVWSDEPGVAAVLAGELDEGRQYQAAPVSDPRDFLPRLALDLRTVRAGKVRLEVEELARYQLLRVEAVLGAVAADGSQSIEATLEFDAKAARVVPPPLHAPGLQGRLRGTRVLDREKGLVSSFSGTTEFTVDYPPHKDGEESRPARRQTVCITDAWTLATVLVADDAEFRGRVTKAIRGSIAALRTELGKRLERPFESGGDVYHDIQPGELALVLLALTRSGEDRRDALLVRGYDELRKLAIQGTYSLAVAILAVEALYTPPGEWGEMRAGRLKAPLPRPLTPEDTAIVSGWCKELLDNVDKTVDAAYVRRWHYGPSESWDNSNTQYALLGLYGAQLCGVEVSPQVWTAAVNHWLQCGVRTGAAELPRITYQADLQKGTRTRPGGAKVQPLGWGYQGANPTGSMTTAGITGLSLCTSALRIQKKGNPKLLAEADAATRAGFLWLEQHLSVRHNPGPSHAWGSWHLYYLYGLERSCELNQVALLGDRDWYFEGALQLLGTQRADGSWGSWVDTAFGLLFLKKTALPAITGR